MKLTILVVTIISSIFAFFGFINGQIMERNKRNPGFETLVQKQENIRKSGKPIYYAFNKSYKSNFFTLQLRRVILFDDCTLVEMFATNSSINSRTASREFYSFLENRDEGFYILANGKQYNSTSVNNDYSYVVNRLPLAEKSLIIVKFDPIPRDSKHINIRTNGKKDRVQMPIELKNAQYLEDNYTTNHTTREASYIKNAEIIRKIDFNYDYPKEDIKINIHTITIGHDYTYVDFDLTNYAPRILYQLDLNNGFSGTLSLSVPNSTLKHLLLKYEYNGKISDYSGRIKVKPNSTVSVRLIFTAISENTRRIEIKGLPFRDNILNVPLK